MGRRKFRALHRLGNIGCRSEGFQGVPYSVGGKDLEITSIDHPLDVGANPADEQRPAAASMSASVARAESCVRRTDHSSDGSATSTRWCTTSDRSARVGLAVPMSRPRYTCIESSETISTSPADSRNRQGQCRLARRGRADEREVSRHTATTGMRTRRRRPARTTPIRSPRSQCGAVLVTRTAARSPGITETSPESPPAVGAKWSSLLCRVRPDHIAGSVFDGPSTSTSSTRRDAPRASRAHCPRPLPSSGSSARARRRERRTPRSSTPLRWLPALRTRRRRRRRK